MIIDFHTHVLPPGIKNNRADYIAKDPVFAQIYANEKAETTVKGLYSAGDETAGTISGAAIFGWTAGDNAPAYIKKAPSPNIDKEKARIEEQKSMIEALQSRRQGTDWKDANIALQQTMREYAGPLRSEPMLDAGLRHLRRLKKKVHESLKADNRWELTRCLEVFNLYDIGELMFLAALERKESRGLHQRIDHTVTNPLLNLKILSVKKVKGKPVFQWRDVEK